MVSEVHLEIKNLSGLTSLAMASSQPSRISLPPIETNDDVMFPSNGDDQLKRRR
jgi:hypothetical protein